MAEVFVTEPLARENFGEQVQSFILSLNILRKNMSIYPSGHLAIDHYAESLSTILQDLFSYTTRITINAIHRNLIVNGELIDANNAYIQDFASYINRIGVASITLLKGLQRDDLVKFCQLTLKIPQNIHIAHSREILDQINAISNLEVREIDLSSVRFSDEELTDNIKTRAPLTIWQKLMLYSLSPNLLHTQDKDLLKTIKIFDRGSFKSFVETFDIPEDRLLQSYKNILHDHFQGASVQTDDLAGKQAFFRSIHENFAAFSPPLKEKILASTFDTLNGITNEQSQKDFLSSIPDDLVAEMLTQAVVDKKEISPLLVKLLIFLYRLGRQSAEKTDGQDLFIDPVWERIEELFSREGYEKYLSGEYAEQLEKLSLKPTEKQLYPIAFSSTEYLKTIEEANVNRHLASAMLFLMQSDIEDQLFTGFVEIIAQLIPDMVEAGDYRDLCTVYKILNKHLADFKRPAASFALDAAIKSFTGDHTVSKLAEIYNAQGEMHHPDLEELIMLTGSNNLPWLVELYLKQNEAALIRQTLNIIFKFGGQASRAALRKLPGSKKQQTVRLLQLIQHCRGDIPTPELRNLLQSRDKEVSHEAIKTLLILNDEAAESALWKMILSKDDDQFYPALKIIHDCRVSDLAARLPQKIKTFYVTKAALERNKAILKLLGKLGVADAIPHLQHIASARFSITPANLQQTQEYLFRTLAGYSEATVKELIAEGLRSKNRQISSTCRELLEMQQQPVNY